MSSPRALPNDPILAMLPEIHGRRILHPCVPYARLGHGGMGAVYLAKHLTLRQRQVVKCLWLLGTGNPGDSVFVERFQQEARIAAEMTHQNLVRVTHVDRLGDLHYLVMEYIDGEDVAKRVRRRGRMSESAALRMLHGAAMGLGYAHARGIVHRDVKPANLMISRQGEVKVIDLGLARASHDRQRLAATIGTLGTPLYMAPEQWDSANVGPAADVWALGATLHFALSGRCHVPDAIQEPSALRRFVTEQPFPELAADTLGVSAAAMGILRRCVARDPSERYADARALAAALAPLLSGDESELADPDGGPAPNGDEPDDAELASLIEALAGDTPGTAATPSAARRPAPAHGPSAGNDPLPVTDGPTVVFRPPAAVDHTSGSPVQHGPKAACATEAATPAGQLIGVPPPQTRRQWPGWLAAAATLATIAGVAVVRWPGNDPGALQREAMAAIYQERYRDADELLQSLEQVPSHADSARRLRLDALCKDAQQTAARHPATAWQRLDTAARVADHLVTPADVTAANETVAATRAQVANALHQALVANVQVIGPTIGSVVTTGRIRVTVRTPAEPWRTLAVGGQPMLRAQDDTWSGEIDTPLVDGPHLLLIRCGIQGLELHRDLEVQVLVQRGSARLILAAPSGPLGGLSTPCAGTVQNGPLHVVAETIAPDGRRSEQDLGTLDGTFVVPLAFGDGDGHYRVRLSGRQGDREVQSETRDFVLDRRPPTFTLQPVPETTNAATLLLLGHADEPCRVLCTGANALEALAGSDGNFQLPVVLPTADGSCELSLTAVDEVDNRTPPTKLRLRIDRTPPQALAGRLQHDSQTRASHLRVLGAIDEPGAIGLEGQGPAPTAPDGSFELSLELPPTSTEGISLLNLLPVDLAGNRGQPIPIQVFVDRQGPRILPGAADGSWWGDGEWQLRIEEPSLPCQVTLGEETKTVGADGRVVFALRSSREAIAVVAQDALGNESRRTLAAPRPGEDRPGKVAPGPQWGTPTDGSAIDPTLNLYERVELAIGGQRVTFRLLRPLRDGDLSSAADPKATALLRNPCYLAETELPLAAWLAGGGLAEVHEGRTFDPTTCKWSSFVGDRRRPLAGALASAAPDACPVVLVTPEEAAAFAAAHGCRLPHEREWLFATRLGSRHRYGWGNPRAIEQRANLADLHLQAIAPGLGAYEPADDGHAGLAPVGAFPQASEVHPFGFRDLLGNAAEWCATDLGRHTARGGSWLSEARELRVDELPRDGLVNGGAWIHIGFRLARDP